MTLCHDTIYYIKISNLFARYHDASALQDLVKTFSKKLVFFLLKIFTTLFVKA